MSWIEQAACEGTELDLWFDPERKDEALTYCRQCDVRETCLEDAIRNGASDGVVGGTIPEERQRLARKRKIVGWHRPSPAYEPLPGPTCSVEDCDGRLYSKGMCHVHYRRVREHGSTSLPSEGRGVDADSAMWVVRRVAAFHRVSVDDVMSDLVRQDVVEARWSVMVELVALGMSYSAVGRLLGRHHTSVMHAVRKVAA